MKNAILITILIIGPLLLRAQSGSPIEIKKMMGTNQFFQNNQKLTPIQVLDKLSESETAYPKMKTAKSNLGAANVFGVVGGALVGWPLGTAAGGGEPNWALAGAGAGAILLALPFNAKFNKLSREAIDEYNAGLQTSSIKPRVDMNVSIWGTGLKLCLNF